MHGLKELRVIDCSSEIAGPYCSKLFADAGADVIKLEAPEGDPLRTWSATGADLGNNSCHLTASGTDAPPAGDCERPAVTRW